MEKIIPSNAIHIKYDFMYVPGEVYYYTDKVSGKPCAIAYRGKSNKPIFWIRFNNELSRDLKIQSFRRDLEAQNEYKKGKEEAKRNFKTSLVVGDILYASWGYDQTNIDFYQIKKLMGNRAIIQEINKKDVTPEGYKGSSMSGQCIAVKDSFIETEPELKKNIQVGDYIKLNSYSGLIKWDGRPLYYSWYA